MLRASPNLGGSTWLLAGWLAGRLAAGCAGCVRLKENNTFESETLEKTKLRYATGLAGESACGVAAGRAECVWAGCLVPGPAHLS